MIKEQTDSVMLEEDLLLLASEGDEAAISEPTKRGYTPKDWWAAWLEPDAVSGSQGLRH